MYLLNVQEFADLTADYLSIMLKKNSVMVRRIDEPVESALVLKSCVKCFIDNFGDRIEISVNDLVDRLAANGAVAITMPPQPYANIYPCATGRSDTAFVLVYPVYPFQAPKDPNEKLMAFWFGVEVHFIGSDK